MWLIHIKRNRIWGWDIESQSLSRTSVNVSTLYYGFHLHRYPSVCTSHYSHVHLGRTRAPHVSHEAKASTLRYETNYISRSSKINFLRKDEVMTLYVKNTVQKISFDTSEVTIPVTTFRRCPMFNVFSVSGKIHASYRSKVNTPKYLQFNKYMQVFYPRHITKL